LKKALPAFVSALQGAERSVIDMLKVRPQGTDAVLRIANWPEPVTLDVGDGYGAETWYPIPFTRSEVRAQADLTIDDLTLAVPNIGLQISDVGTLQPGAYALNELALGGLFDGAEVSLYQLSLAGQIVFHHSDWIVSAILSADRTQVSFHLQSFIARLMVRSPLTTFQDQCNNALFDQFCGLLRSAYLVAGTALGGTHSQVFSAVGGDDGYYALGAITFTSGANAGVGRTVASFAGGTFGLMADLPYAVSGGDTFTAVPGCNKTVEACQSKFSNLANYRGFPAIPDPTVLI